MLIDCDSCAARPRACADCVVTVLLGPPSSEHELDETERQALNALADGGLIPPLRLVPLVPVDALSSRLREQDQQRGRTSDGPRTVAG